MAAAEQTAFTIRSAHVDDAAALSGLSTQLGYPVDASEMSARLARIRAARAGEVFVAVDLAQRVIGWTHVVPRLQLEDGAYAELAGLVVDAGMRSTGVGAALLRAAEDWASTHGFTRMRVRSNVIRERAHRFYLRAGYVERKRQAVFERPLSVVKC